jgi:hypothetical protein
MFLNKVTILEIDAQPNVGRNLETSGIDKVAPGNSVKVHACIDASRGLERQSIIS